MKLPIFEDVAEAIIFELNRIRDSKERLTLIIANNPNFFTNEQIKTLIQETVSI